MKEFNSNDTETIKIFRNYDIHFLVITNPGKNTFSFDFNLLEISPTLVYRRISIYLGSAGKIKL